MLNKLLHKIINAKAHDKIEPSDQINGEVLKKQPSCSLLKRFIQNVRLNLGAFKRV